MATMISKISNKFQTVLYQILDGFYLPLDREQIQRTKNIQLIPLEPARRIGKHAYAEWAHVIGIFQTLILLEIADKPNNQVLDIGCGTGLMGIACEPFLGPDGKYTGIDIVAEYISFCRNHFPPQKFEFIHLDVNNPLYAPTQQNNQDRWPVDSASMDLVTALSVWTHFQEQDALFYLGEVDRVLKPGGKAIITFFRLDNHYHDTLNNRDHEESRFHNTAKDRWIFDQPAYGSQEWRCPGWAKTPESAIGITNQGFSTMVASTELKVAKYYPGNWKDIPGLYFQDVVIFQKHD